MSDEKGEGGCPGFDARYLEALAMRVGSILNRATSLQPGRRRGRGRARGGYGAGRGHGGADHRSDLFERARAVQHIFATETARLLCTRWCPFPAKLPAADTEGLGEMVAGADCWCGVGAPERRPDEMEPLGYGAYPGGVYAGLVLMHLNKSKLPDPSGDNYRGNGGGVGGAAGGAGGGGFGGTTSRKRASSLKHAPDVGSKQTCWIEVDAASLAVWVRGDELPVVCAPLEKVEGVSASAAQPFGHVFDLQVQCGR